MKNPINDIFKAHRETIMERPKSPEQYVESMNSKGITAELNDLNKTIQMELNGEKIKAQYEKNKDILEIDLDLENHNRQMELNQLDMKQYLNNHSQDYEKNPREIEKNSDLDLDMDIDD